MKILIKEKTVNFELKKKQACRITISENFPILIPHRGPEMTILPVVGQFDPLPVTLKICQRTQT